jgi:hypothetical protein
VPVGVTGHRTQHPAAQGGKGQVGPLGPHLSQTSSTLLPGPGPSRAQREEGARARAQCPPAGRRGNIFGQNVKCKTSAPSPLDR